MNFTEHIYSLPDNQRLSFLNNLSKYGEANDILKELFETPVVFDSKKLEVRCTKNVLLWFVKNSCFHPARTYLLKINEFDNCYHSYAEGNVGNSIIGFITRNGEHLKIPVSNNKDSVSVYNLIRPYIKGFDNITPYDQSEINNVAKFPCPYYAEGYYVFKNNSIHLVRPVPFKKGVIKDETVIEDINGIIWCRQYYSDGGESPDTYGLELYLTDRKNSYDLRSNSEYEVYQFAIELKKRLPHLLYGHSDEYKAIHKRNPHELMALAKSKAYHENKRFN